MNSHTIVIFTGPHHGREYYGPIITYDDILKGSSEVLASTCCIQGETMTEDTFGQVKRGSISGPLKNISFEATGLTDMQCGALEGVRLHLYDNVFVYEVEGEAQLSWDNGFTSIEDLNQVHFLPLM